MEDGVDTTTKNNHMGHWQQSADLMITSGSVPNLAPLNEAGKLQLSLVQKLGAVISGARLYLAFDIARILG